MVGPELRQYMFNPDHAGKPFSRNDYTNIVISGKYLKTLISYGSKRDFEQPGWYIRNALLTNLAEDMEVNLSEDSSITFDLDWDDVDNILEELTFTIIQDPEHGTYELNNVNQVTYSGNPDYLGEDELVFSVTDGEYVVEATVDITISEINDAPILTEIPVIEFYEDTDTTIVLDGYDVDENSLTYSFSESDANLGFEIKNQNQLKITTEIEHYNGPGEVTVEITEIIDPNTTNTCPVEIPLLVDTFDIYNMPDPSDTQVVVNEPICLNEGANFVINDAGTTTTIELEDGDYDVAYTLDGPGGMATYIKTATVTGGMATIDIASSEIATDGDYTITITSFTSIYGCETATSLTDEFVVYPLPDAQNITVSIDDTCEDETITVTINDPDMGMIGN